MEFDKKLGVIDYQGSKIQAIQNLINDLNTEIGQPKYAWKNLEDTVSLAEQIQEIADVLKEDTIIVSIVAGKSIAFIQEGLGGKARKIVIGRAHV